MALEVWTTAVTVVASAGSAAGAVAVAAWTLRGWLAEQFNVMREQFNERHLENLERFTKIRLALIKLGADDPAE